MVTHHVKVTGEVQGVFFRANAKKIASSLGLTGWIKNTKDNAVEAKVSGQIDNLRTFETWCKSGPPKATVEDVLVTDTEYEQFDDFVIIR